MMADTVEVSTSSASELLASGRRNLAVKEFTSAVDTLAAACEILAKEHGDTADQCAEAYLWYGKALLGLSREESGVLGDGVPGTGNAEDEEENEEQEENSDSEEKTGEAEAVKENGEAPNKEIEEGTSNEVATEKEAESTTNDEGMSADDEEPGTTNGDAEEGEGDADVSMMNAETEDDVDNLQLAWEMLDLSRSILFQRVQDGGGDAARALLADVHLALGEVALESETYDKAVIDMQSCLDLQKDLYGADDRRIAETHYQIGLANSLASNFEDAITHFKNAANILGSRIKALEAPGASEDATVKKHSTDPGYSIEGEIKELKELLPEIQEKIQDMMDYKTETLKRMRASLFSNGSGSPSSSVSTMSGGAFSNGSNSNDSGSSRAKPAADISHLIKRKRKASESEPESTAKKPSTVSPKAKAEGNEAESKAPSVVPDRIPVKNAEVPEKVTKTKTEADSSKTET